MQIPRLHPDTVEQVKQRADVVDIVSEHVVLRKRGKDFVGLCPFHDEKTPSFSVSPGKQMYYCFGCGAGGNAITFLMELGKTSFSEVVLDLARRYSVPVQTLEPEQRQELQRQISLREQLYEVMAVATQFYHHALQQHQGQLALDYLQQKRQFNSETIQQFKLGYAPAGWETLYRYLVEQKRYPVQIVEQAGLIRQRQSKDGYYDYFRDRIIIPICDPQGRFIGFGGRSLGDEQPKYLNSPETDIFNKGRTLFCLDKAKNEIAKQDRVVVVEGYFDAIALHAAGITHSVASLGTALSIEQVRACLRYSESKQLILNFDADAAGTQATERAIGAIANLAYQGEVNLRILNLPDGKDADEYLHTHSPEHYRELLHNAPLWLDWQILQLVANRDLKQAPEAQQVMASMVKLLQQISDSNQRQHYIHRCAEILSLGDARLVPLWIENLLDRVAPNSYRKPAPPRKQQASNSHLPVAGDRALLEQAEAILLRIYLHHPEYRQIVTEALQERDLQFDLPHHSFLWQQILENLETLSVSSPQSSDLISRLQVQCMEYEGETKAIARLFHLDEKTQIELSRFAQVIQAATACMERVQCEKRYRQFLQLWEQTDEVTAPEQSQSYFESLRQAQQRLLELDKQRQFALADLI
ncbi:DNA primase [Scytonema millei]|uniref:DNA primase n=1 Tax=Scytonema millei VB511283 TaxID=1245923 RepID=A0A9X5I3Z5_9CYAN|nr:DNA primase [Scytonema millei]NHC34079.1 DNA primase [Scytonema millei VB511283]